MLLAAGAVQFLFTMWAMARVVNRLGLRRAFICGCAFAGAVMSVIPHVNGTKGHVLAGGLVAVTQVPSRSLPTPPPPLPCRVPLFPPSSPLPSARAVTLCRSLALPYRPSSLWQPSALAEKKNRLMSASPEIPIFPVG